VARGDGFAGRIKVSTLVTLLSGWSTLKGNLMHRFSRDGLELSPAIDCLEGAASYFVARSLRMMLPSRMPMRIQDK
jgi:hypothetical protein